MDPGGKEQCSSTLISKLINTYSLALEGTLTPSLMAFHYRNMKAFWERLRIEWLPPNAEPGLQKQNPEMIPLP